MRVALQYFTLCSFKKDRKAGRDLNAKRVAFQIEKLGSVVAFDGEAFKGK